MRALRIGRGHLYHHGRFYGAALFGAAVYAACRALHGSIPLAAAADGFFLAYLAAALWHLMRSTPADLKRRAAREDEGILLVVALTLGIIAVNLIMIFTALNGGEIGALWLTLLLAAAPLGWFVLHTISAFHYANLHYFEPPGDGEAGRALAFPGTKTPDLWDFLYFSFVIGMTAQVSDVQIREGSLRRAVLGHSVVSFFFNTVLIALVINAVVRGR
jgi:uncharacterized membrane protein